MTSDELKEDFRTFLQSEYTKRCQKNPYYSLRAFAKQIDIDPSSLSQFIRNKRNLSEKKMKEIGKKLNLKPEEFVKYVSSHNSKEFQLIQLDQFSLLSEWYHLAIYHLMELEEFKSDINWIAKRLGIQVHQARSAIDRLIRLGWVVEKNGKYKYVGGNLSTLDHEITNEALKNHQKEVLSLAQESIDENELDYRSNTGMTMAISKKKVKEAEAMITRFRRRLSKFLEDTDEKDEVYQLSIALFPLTKLENSK